jgi:hypothetical protein
LSWFFFGEQAFSTSSQQIFFDPFHIANDLNFARLREAELKHGCICMLAVTATVVVALLPVTENNNNDDDWWYHHETTTTLTYPSGILPCLTHLCSSDVGRVIMTCGILETIGFVPQESTAMPGDYGVGYFGIRDKALNEKSLVSEFENGRLAMMAFIIQLVAEIVTDGKSWEEQWLEIVKPWLRQVLQLYFVAFLHISSIELIEIALDYFNRM